MWLLTVGNEHGPGPGAVVYLDEVPEGFDYEN